MNANKILRTIQRKGEIPFSDLHILRGRGKDHYAFYPLVQLIESEYVGTTVNFGNVPGGEKSREYEISIYLHMETIPRNEKGEREYLGLHSSGKHDQNRQKIFLKAKGFLYLAEQEEKRKERVINTGLAILVGILVGSIVGWLKANALEPLTYG